MGELTDPRPLARVVVIVVAVWMVVDVLLRVAITSLSTSTLGLGWNLSTIRAVGLLAFLHIGSYVVAAITTGRWIWRTNRNAHGLATGMSITPGWAVGWFFVPVAHLFKPFEAMKETWQVSHDPNGWPLVPVPAWVRWWWGMWLASNIGANLSWQLSRNGFAEQSLIGLQWLTTVLAVAAGTLLIRLARALSAAQAQAIAAQAFI